MGLPTKHERLGLSKKQMKDAEKIAAYPDIVNGIMAKTS
jgi:hypothetical protein